MQGVSAVLTRQEHERLSDGNCRLLISQTSSCSSWRHNQSLLPSAHPLPKPPALEASRGPGSSLCFRNVGILWNNHFIGDSHPLRPAVAASCVFYGPAAGHWLIVPVFQLCLCALPRRKDSGLPTQMGAARVALAPGVMPGRRASQTAEKPETHLGSEG